MATTRFQYNNLAGAPNVSITCDQTGNPNFPITNLLTDDRYTPWVYSAQSSADATIEVDLGGVRSVSVIGLLGLRRLTWDGSPNSSALSLPSSALVYSGTTYPATAARPVMTLGSDGDYGTVDIAYTARYLKIVLTPMFTGVSALSIGRLWVGGPLTDMGVQSSPGEVRSFRKQRVRTTSASGIPIIRNLGPTRRTVLLPFRAMPKTKVDAIQASLDVPKSMLLVDWQDRLMECVPDGDTFDTTRTWGSPDLYDFDLRLEVLP